MAAIGARGSSSAGKVMICAEDGQVGVEAFANATSLLLGKFRERRPRGEGAQGLLPPEPLLGHPAFAEAIFRAIAVRSPWRGSTSSTGKSLPNASVAPASSA